MPAPWGPYPPDHDALVAERERRADEGEMPVVPKEECVVAGREAVVECEIVVRMTPATPRVTAAPMTVHRPRAWRREVHNFAIARSSRVRGLPTQPSDHWFVAVLRQICALKGMGLWSQSALAHLTRLHGSGRERVEETMRRTAACLLICGLATILAGNALAQEIDWKKVDAALGRTGAAMPGGVQRYALPRSDLNVAVDGVAIKPALALGGWVAFEPAHGGAMVMGDVVLTETEIKPVMTKLLEGGLEITALHNHLLRANPATFY